MFAENHFLSFTVTVPSRSHIVETLVIVSADTLVLVGVEFVSSFADASPGEVCTGAIGASDDCGGGFRKLGSSLTVVAVAMVDAGAPRPLRR